MVSALRSGIRMQHRVRDTRLSLRKRLAQKLRSLQAITPWQLHRLGDANANPGHHVGNVTPREQRERRSVERKSIVFVGDAERLTQFSRPGTAQTLALEAASLPHRSRGSDAASR